MKAGASKVRRFSIRLDKTLIRDVDRLRKLAVAGFPGMKPISRARTISILLTSGLYLAESQSQAESKTKARKKR